MLLLLACTPEDASPPEPEADTRVESAPLDEPEIGLQLSIGPVTVPPGGDLYWCRITRLPNPEPLDVVALEHAASQSMHHFNVWGLLVGPDEEMEGPCDELWGEVSMQVSSPLYASQDPTFYGEFPEGVAGSLPPDQLVLLEYHVINTGTTDVSAEATLNIHAAEPGSVETYANGIYGSIDDLALPPHEESVFAEKCFVDHDVEVFVLGSHFHARGTRFEIFGLDDAGEAGELLYVNEDWSSPELLMRSDDPLHVPAGGGFEFRCHYRNDGDETVLAGESADEEMCMMVAIYYPDRGFLRCRSG
ncbi:MAG: hypothetical protein ACOZNI_17250 [Myxococcota bacterium]